MRILHLIPALQKGGAERLCLDMVRGLTRKGAEARIAVLRPQNEFADEFPSLETFLLNDHVVPSLTRSWNVRLADWEALLKDYRPDVVHSHLYEAEMVSRHSPQPGIRYFTHCHDNMRALHRFTPSDIFSKKRLTELYERRFLIRQYRRCQNTFLAISADTQAYFLKNLPQEAGRVELLPNAVDMDRFRRKAVPPKKGEVLRLINVGSFFPIKNQAFLLDVLAELLRRETEARISFVGDGPEMEPVKQKAAQMGLLDRLDFLGKRSDVADLLARSHLYIHAGKKEGFGLVLVEAMAAGLPVVTLDGGGNRDLIRPGKNGYLIQQGNIGAFADAILETAKETVWPTMARHAADFAQRYDMETYCDRLLQIYNNPITP